MIIPVMCPSILTTGGGGAAILSDIMFLAKKEFDAKTLAPNESTRTTTGDLATLTAGGGKDMYLASAKVNAIITGTGNGTVTVELKVNGVIVETYSADLNHGTAPDSGNSTDSYSFNVIGVKVAATQIIKLEVTAISDVTINGVIQCWEETTGVTPVI